MFPPILESVNFKLAVDQNLFNLSIGSKSIGSTRNAAPIQSLSITS